MRSVFAKAPFPARDRQGGQTRAGKTDCTYGERSICCMRGSDRSGSMTGESRTIVRG